MCHADLSSEGFLPQLLGVLLADSLQLSTLQDLTQLQRATLAKVVPLLSLPILERQQYKGYRSQLNPGQPGRVILAHKLPMGLAQGVVGCAKQLNFSLCPPYPTGIEPNILHTKLGVSMLHGKPVEKRRDSVLFSSSKEHNYTMNKSYTETAFGFNKFLSTMKQPSSKSSELCKTEGALLLLEASLSTK